jgi:hypothetical protein
MPNEWSEILSQLEPGPGPGLYRPSLSRSVAGILPSALELLGLDAGPHCSRLPRIPAGARSRRFDKLLFILVDSLGLDDLLRREGLLTRWYRSHGDWLTTVFPSITSTAITSITHGVQPAAHGIAGHRVWDSHVGNVVDMLTLHLEGASIALPDAGVDVSGWTGTRPVFSGSNVGDIPCYHLTHSPLLGSGLSNFVLPPNMIRLGYKVFAEGLSKARQLLERDGPGIVSFYFSAIDYISHCFGKGSPEFGHQMDELELGLEWLVKMLPPAVRERTLFALASDHGQCMFDPAKAIPMSNRRQELYRSWGPHHGLGNSGRVMHLYGDGDPPAALAEALAEDLEGRGVLLEAAEACRLAGAPRDTGWPGLGARVAVLREGAYFHFEQTPERMAANARNLDRFVANHGSLTAEELLVPTVLAGLDELQAVGCRL